MPLRLGFNRGVRTKSAWYKQGKADGVDPVLWLDFVNNRYAVNGAAVPLANIFTFSRASSGTYFDISGVLQTAGIDVLRIGQNGLRFDESSTNNLLWCRDLTNAVWVKVTCTAALNQTGIDGVANTATLLTATASDASVLQTITTSGNRTFSAFVKRVTGSGVVEMTRDAGTTWVPITLTGKYTRFAIENSSVVNPTCGFRIRTAGDEIAVDYTQDEGRRFYTMPILTTTSAVSRAQDILRATSANAIPFASWWPTGAASLFTDSVKHYSPFALWNTQCGASDGTPNNVVAHRSYYIDEMMLLINTGGVAQYYPSPQYRATDLQRIKAMTAYNTNNAIAYVNATALGADNSVTIPVVDRFLIGERPNLNGDYFNGTFRDLRVYPIRVTNSELARITA